jgi:predicted nucleic acid-binding protein
VTERPEAAVADTSLFIAQEQQRPLKASPPRQLAVSIVTVAELRLGVLAAADVATRARRLRTVTAVAALDPLAIDDAVAAAWAELRSSLRDNGKRMPLNDSWIAATALAHRLPIATRDDDYDAVPGLTVIKL